MQTTSADSDFLFMDDNGGCDEDDSALLADFENDDLGLAQIGEGFEIFDDLLAGMGVPAQQGGLLSLTEISKLSEKGKIPNELPIAVVLPEAKLLNLQEPRQYLVPEKLVAKLQVGMLVRIRLAGKLINGWVVSLQYPQKISQKLGLIEKIVGKVALLRPEIYHLCQLAAGFYGGSVVGILKRGIPARHAGVEKEFLKHRPDFLKQMALQSLGANVYGPENGGGGVSLAKKTLPVPGQEQYESETNLAEQDKTGRAGKKVYRLKPEIGFKIPVTQLKDLALAQLDAVERGFSAAPPTVDSINDDNTTTVLLFAELHSAQQFYDWFICQLPTEIRQQVAFYHGSLAAAERYEIFLRALAGELSLVVGLRSAVFLPVPNLNRVILWDDGSDNYREESRPYWHTREIAQIRAYTAGAEYILAGYTVSVVGAALCDDGGSLSKWLGDREPASFIDKQPEPVSPVLSIKADQYYYQQIPSRVMQKIGQALEVGAVLVQVPHRTQVQTWGCAQCGEQQYCPACNAVLQVINSPTMHYWQCRHCYLQCPPQCLNCGSRQIRLYNRGLAFTIRNLAANFRQVPLVESRVGFSLVKVNNDPQIVVSTPGAEPVCVGGYALVVVADADLLLSFDRPWVGAEALRRWANVAALAKPAAPVLLLGAIGTELAQVAENGSIFAWAKAQYHARAELGFPPAGRLFAVVAEKTTLRRFLYELQWPAGDILGPIPLADGSEKALLRIPRLYVSVPVEGNEIDTGVEEDTGRKITQQNPFFRQTEISEAKALVENLYRLRIKAISGKWGKLQIVADPDNF